jgi:hypothetical protein
MSHWVLIEAGNPAQYEHVVIGPLADDHGAVAHLRHSAQVERMCQEDAVDAWSVATDTAKDATVARWQADGQPWGLYRAVRDTEAADLRCVNGTPTGLALMPAGRTGHPRPSRGRAR